MPPGPHEATAEQLQNYLKIIVDDLIYLYEEGMVIETPEHPEGKFGEYAKSISSNNHQSD
jgi:hypothetical protein